MRSPYRIAQEAVNNAVKHGRASQVTIDLQVTTENVTLIVRDNGSGMARDAQLSRGMGLKIMHYRASMLSGAVALEACGGRRFTGDSAVAGSPRLRIAVSVRS